MNEHTPGPWIFDQDNVGGREYGYGIYTPESGFTLCSVPVNRGGDSDYQRDEQRQIANARLIAAAPELLEALQTVMSDAWGMSDTAILKGRAAIAKALGQEAKA